jgi:hypothetical protein
MIFLWGVRIRYPGSEQVWTIVSKYRDIDGEFMKGTIAAWEADLTKIGLDRVVGSFISQSICGHYPETEEDRYVEIVN